MKTKIVVDSASSLYALKGVDFACVPLKIITDDAEYLDDGTLDAVGMARSLRTYKGKTSTSCPNVADWLAAYEGAEQIFVATITGTLSGSYNAAQLAAEEYQQENPGKRVFVLDSLSTGPEQRLLAEHLRDLLGVEADQALGQMVALLVVHPDGVAGGEIALHFHHAGRKQAGHSPAHRLGRAGIGHQRALRVGGEADTHPT